MKKLDKYDIKIIKRTFKYLKPLKISMILLIIVTFIIIMFELLQPLLMGNILDEVALGNTNKIFYIIVLIVLVSFGNVIFTYKENILLAKISNNIECDVKKDIFDKFIEIDYKHYEEIKRGEFLEKIEQDSKIFATLLLQLISGIISDLLSLIMMGYIILKINYKLSLVLIASFPISMYLYFIYGRKIRKINNNYKIDKDVYLTFLNEIMSGFKLSKIFRAEKFFKFKYNEQVLKITDLKINAAKKYAESDFFNGIINITSYALILILGIYEISNSRLTLGEFVAFNSYSSSFTTALFSITKLNTKIQEALVSLIRVFILIDRSTEYSEVESNKKYSGKLNFKEDIIIKNLSFAYGNEQILKGINCRIEKNKVNAIIGVSGCGKSTLLNILMGIYDGYSGEITIDNISYKNISKEDLFKKVVLVNQEEVLITGSIRENLTLGKNNVTEEELVEACKFVNIYDYIANLPDKFDTILGKNGIKVSVGQKQRLSIARALIKKADIYLLDEITSALDSESEEFIIKLMKKLSNKSTVIIVSHKENTILNADNVFRIKNGTMKKCEN